MRCGGAQKFYSAEEPIKIWIVSIDNIVILKVVETKNNSKHLIGYLIEIIRPLGLILPKMSEYVKTFKDKYEDINNKGKMEI